MSTPLSIVVPAFNEELRIGASLADIMRFAREHEVGAEILVVDDGSTDRTAEVVSTFHPEAGEVGIPLRLIRHEVNRGKGAAVRTGFQNAAGDIVLFTDADLSTPIHEATRVISPIASGECDVVVGSRALDPSVITVQQSRLRRTMGRVFNWVARISTGLRIYDTQCGFKAFRRDVSAPVFALQRLDGFAFDVELLYLAARTGLRIREVPVAWGHFEDSKVSLVPHGGGMLRDLARIRLNDWRGLYPVPDRSNSSGPRA